MKEEYSAFLGGFLMGIAVLLVFVIGFIFGRMV